MKSTLKNRRTENSKFIEIKYYQISKGIITTE